MVIPEIQLDLNPRTEEAEKIIGFEWASEEIGKRNKIGGKPDWIQEQDIPKCSCGKEMTFYGQLDSIGNRIVLADCGMIYVFVCFDCFQTRSVLQSY